MTAATQPIAVKDVLANEAHPLHNTVKEVVDGLHTGKFSMCACMGPVYGEPYCPCQMAQRGLEPSPLHQQAMAEQEARLQDFCLAMQKKRESL